MKLLVIGSGLSGAVLANRYAKEGKEVVILEKRDHIGGNIYDHHISGVLVHKYGPHIFHTNNERVAKYMEDFWKLNGYQNRVNGMIADKIAPIPFNFKGIETFWPDQSEEIKNKLINKFGLDSRISIFDMLEVEDEQLKMVADFIYKNVVENYTSKMWGLSPKEIDPSVIKRVPVTIGYGDRYFSDKFEGLPEEGYTKAIEKMIDSNLIKIETNVNAADLISFEGDDVFYKGEKVKCPIIYTGPLDELFKYKFGPLSYRSLKFKFEEINKERFQETAVVNYPADPEMTRITEYKNMTLQKSHNTLISKEYPGEFSLDSKDFNVPYYPMATDKSREQYVSYEKEISKYKNIYPLGRLAQYKYLNMDQIIDNALELADKLLGE